MAEKSADVLRPVGAAQGPGGRGVGAIAVVGPNQRAIVYYTRPVTVPTPGGAVAIPAYTPAVIFGGTSPAVDLSTKRWYTVTLDGAGGFYLVAEADWPAFVQAHDAVRLEYITRTDVRRAQPRPPILLPVPIIGGGTPTGGVTGYVFWLEPFVRNGGFAVYPWYDSDSVLRSAAIMTATVTFGDGVSRSIGADDGSVRVPLALDADGYMVITCNPDGSLHGYAGPIPPSDGSVWLGTVRALPRAVDAWTIGDATPSNHVSTMQTEAGATIPPPALGPTLTLPATEDMTDWWVHGEFVGSPPDATELAALGIYSSPTPGETYPSGVPTGLFGAVATSPSWADPWCCMVWGVQQASPLALFVAGISGIPTFDGGKRYFDATGFQLPTSLLGVLPFIATAADCSTRVVFGSDDTGYSNINDLALAHLVYGTGPRFRWQGHTSLIGAGADPLETYGVYTDPILLDLAGTLTAQAAASAAVWYLSSNRLASIGTAVLGVAADGSLWYTPINNVTPGLPVELPALAGGSTQRCYGVNRSEDGTTWWALVEYTGESAAGRTAGAAPEEAQATGAFFLGPARTETLPGLGVNGISVQNDTGGAYVSYLTWYQDLLYFPQDITFYTADGVWHTALGGVILSGITAGTTIYANTDRTLRAGSGDVPIFAISAADGSTLMAGHALLSNAPGTATTGRAIHRVTSTAAAPTHAADWALHSTLLPPVAPGDSPFQALGIAGNGAVVTRGGDDGGVPDQWSYVPASGSPLPLASLDDWLSGGPGRPGVAGIKFDQDGAAWVGGAVIDAAGAFDTSRGDADGATGDGAGGIWAVSGGALLQASAGTWADTGIQVWADTRTLYDMSRSGKYLDWLLSVPGQPTQLQLYQADTSTYVPPGTTPPSGTPIPGTAPGCPTATANDGVRSDSTEILSFTCDVTNPDLGAIVTLTATVNQDLSPTFWDLIIYDESGTKVKDVGSGTTAVYSVSNALATSHTYHAELRWWRNEAFGTAAASGTIAVAWAAGGYDPGTAVPGSMTITPYPAIDLAVSISGAAAGGVGGMQSPSNPSFRALYDANGVLTGIENVVFTGVLPDGTTLTVPGGQVIGRTGLLGSAGGTIAIGFTSGGTLAAAAGTVQPAGTYLAAIVTLSPRAVDGWVYSTFDGTFVEAPPELADGTAIAASAAASWGASVTLAHPADVSTYSDVSGGPYWPGHTGIWQHVESPGNTNAIPTDDFPALTNSPSYADPWCCVVLFVATLAGGSGTFSWHGVSETGTGILGMILVPEDLHAVPTSDQGEPTDGNAWRVVSRYDSALPPSGHTGSFCSVTGPTISVVQHYGAPVPGAIASYAVYGTPTAPTP